MFNVACNGANYLYVISVEMWGKCVVISVCDQTVFNFLIHFHGKELPNVLKERHLSSSANQNCRMKTKAVCSPETSGLSYPYRCFTFQEIHHFSYTAAKTSKY